MVAYLDNAATTPLRPEALEAMMPFLVGRFGNPSGAHSVARDARKALEEAREQVAELLGARPAEVVLTSGGTEADNLAVIGGHAARPGAVVCSAVEHHAVLHSAASLGAKLAPVDADGVVDLEALAEMVGPDTRIVAVMAANNEVGTIQPVPAIARLVAEQAPDARVVCDAVQAFSWLDVAAHTAEAGLVAISAHKFGGPKGVGALVVRRGSRVRPILHGGGQEHDRRSGTHNVAGVVGMAAAMAVTAAQRAETVQRVGALRDRLADGLLGAVPGVAETGERSRKIAGNCHLTFAGIEAESLLVLLDAEGICASAASACSSGAAEPSHVLAAMGIDRTRATGALRLSLGSTTTTADVDHALEVIPAAAAQLREAAA